MIKGKRKFGEAFGSNENSRALNHFQQHFEESFDPNYLATLVASGSETKRVPVVGFFSF